MQQAGGVFGHEVRQVQSRIGVANHSSDHPGADGRGWSIGDSGGVCVHAHLIIARLQMGSWHLRPSAQRLTVDIRDFWH